MKHRVAGRKLGRTTEHKLALMRNLSTELFRYEKIRTTLAKAKELRPFAERLVTISKRETLNARRLVARHIHDRGVVSKLFDTLSARYSERPGGYTRILKLGPRRGDNAEMAIIELVDAATSDSHDDASEAAKGKAKKAKVSKKVPRKAAAKPAEGEVEAGDEKPTKKKSTKKKASSKKASASTGAPAKKAGSKRAPKAKTASRRSPKGGD